MTLALTHSSWINAWTLRRACAELGVDLRVPAHARELPLPTLPEGRQPEWLFFTEEASLARALQGGEAARFLPRQFPARLLDDKWAFAEFLTGDAKGPAALPQWSLAEAGLARYPLLLKSRHSWAGERKLPRGWVCRDADELAARRAGLPAQGLREEWFFLQAWLGDTPLQLLSVGGFFDAEDERRNLALLTERVADYGAGPSSSAMLVTVPDRLGLLAQAERVLRRLAFRGPYEFEFIVRGGEVLALELNPRFWMQHGLFLAVGNGLVKRYLGLDGESDRMHPASAAPPALLWVDGSWLLRRVLRLDRQVWRLWREWVGRRGHRAVVCPPLGAAAVAGLWRVLGGGRP